MNLSAIKNGLTLVGVSYVPLIDSMGTCCENCGRAIANIATVKHTDGTHYVIGLDCAETLLSEEVYNEAKSGISSKKRIADKIKKLESAGKEYVLDEYGIPCFPPAKRNGYYIPY